MAQIFIHRDPSNITGVERYDVQGEVNLADWLIDNECHNFAGLHAQITLNGTPIFRTWEGEPEQHNQAIDVMIGHFDTVSIIIRPQGIVPIIAAVLVVTVAVSIALAPKPIVPSSLTDSGGEGRSSNNQLNAAKNAYRPRQAIPDIGGQVVSYPDFAQLSYYEYQSNKRVFREIFCVGVGQYNVEDVKIGDDLLLNGAGNEYQQYYNQSPHDLLNIRPNTNSLEVDLPNPGEGEASVYFSDIGSVDATSNRITLGATLMNDLALQVGNTVELDFSYKRPPDPDEIVLGSGTVLTVDSTGFTTDFDIFFDGNRLSGYVRKTDGETPEVWYTLEGDAIEEVWLDLKMPSGIKSNTGGFDTITSTFTIEKLDANGNPTGVTFERGCVFAGNTRSAQYQTFKFTQDDGIGIGKFRAKVEKISGVTDDNAINLLTMESVKSVTPYTANFGDVTLLDVTRLSNARVSRGQSDKLNCLVTRKLRIYDHVTQTYGVTYEATRRFCDYVFYLLHERAGVEIEDIDLSLFDIFDDLTDEQLGYFDGTFDDKNMSLRDRVELACNVVRVRYWNVGLKWFFVREQARPVSSMMFNRRNLKRDQRLTQSFRRPSDYDGVTIRYVDPTTNSESQVYRSISEAGSIVNDEGNNSLEFNLTVGCRNEIQAVNRAELEVRRLIRQNIKVTDTALAESLEMQIGERVDYVDIFDGDTFDGEIIAISGNVYTTSERFEPVNGVDYYVYITDDSGNISNSVRAYPRSDGKIYGFEATGLTGAYLATGEIQSGSRYVIASADDMEAQSYIAIGRGAPNELGECTIELAEYDPLMYEAD